ncbi:hypothetical protein [Photobacterium damselae]|uniref:hypothetical protein n=1 Tax=Photobacterium damselae TaxID=38293 RepID=UPI004068488D
MSHTISNLDVLELASRMLGHTDAQFEKYIENDEEDQIEAQLTAKFNIDFGDFRNLVCALLPMSLPVKSAVGDIPMFCFGVQEKNYFRSIVQIDASKHDSHQS